MNERRNEEVLLLQRHFAAALRHGSAVAPAAAVLLTPARLPQGHQQLCVCRKGLTRIEVDVANLYDTHHILHMFRSMSLHTLAAASPVVEGICAAAPDDTTTALAVASARSLDRRPQSSQQVEACSDSRFQAILLRTATPSTAQQQTLMTGCYPFLKAFRRSAWA